MARDYRAEGQPAAVGALVGAALRAMIQADALAQQETLDYIVNVGLAGDKRRAVTLDFEYEHPVPDPLRPGEFNSEVARVSAPLLTLIQIPSLQIEEANVDLVVHVADAHEMDKQDHDVYPRSAPRMQLLGVLGREARRTQLPSIAISMKVKRADRTEAFDQLNRVLADSITVVSPSEAKRPAGRRPGDPREPREEREEDQGHAAE